MSSWIRGSDKFLFCLCIQMFVCREERKYLKTKCQEYSLLIQCAIFAVRLLGVISLNFIFAYFYYFLCKNFFWKISLQYMLTIFFSFPRFFLSYFSRSLICMKILLNWFFSLMWLSLYASSYLKSVPPSSVRNLPLDHALTFSLSPRLASQSLVLSWVQDQSRERLGMKKAFL